MKPGTDPFSQLDDALHTVSGQKGVAQYLLRMLSDAIDAARPLDEPYDGPGQAEKRGSGLMSLKAAARASAAVGTDYAPVGLTWVLEQRRNQQTTDAAGKVNR